MFFNLPLFFVTRQRLDILCISMRGCRVANVIQSACRLRQKSRRAYPGITMYCYHAQHCKCRHVQVCF